MKNGTLVTFSSEFTLHGACNYPLRYVIHLFTKSKVEHMGIMCDGYIYEAKGCGVIKTLLSERLIHTNSYVSVHYLYLKKELTKDQVKVLRVDLEAQLGKKYSLKEAMLSAIDHLLPKFIKDKRSKHINTREQFCSKLCAYAYRNLGLLKEVLPRDINPGELIELVRPFMKKL